MAATLLQSRDTMHPRHYAFNVLEPNICAQGEGVGLTPQGKRGGWYGC